MSAGAAPVKRVCMEEPRFAPVLVVVFVLDVVQHIQVTRTIRSARNNLVAHTNRAIEWTPTMSGTEQSILQALVELDTAVKAMATAQPKLDLRPLFGRIDELTRQLPSDVDPDLRH